MKLATFTYRGATGLGKVVGGEIIDIGLALPDLPREMEALLAAGAPAMEALLDLGSAGRVKYPLAEVRLEAPLRRPSKILAIGLNYQDHAEEARKKGIAPPAVQLWFNKQVSAVNAPNDPIHRPRISAMLDYELELGVVIGKRCRHVSAAKAPGVVAGYTIVNDVSARDIQWRSPTWTVGKSFDTHCPIGPWLVTSHEIRDPHNLEMKLWVNGELRQSGNSRLMIHNIWQQIEHLTEVMTLEPGDVLVTGTPAGVGAAFDPPRYLQTGDVVRLEIEGIGQIEHRVIDEPV